MAYNEITDANIDVDSFGREDVVFQYLRDNIRALRETIFPVVFSETSTSSTGYVTLASFTLEIPDVTDYTGITRELEIILDAKVASGTGSVQLEENGTGSTGSAVTFTGTSYAATTFSMSVQSGWAGSARVFNIRAKNSGTNLTYLQSVDRITARLTY